MRTWIRLLWTAAIVIAVAWPFLFWGKAASLDRSGSEYVQRPLMFNPLERHDILW